MEDPEAMYSVRFLRVGYIIWKWQNNSLAPGWNVFVWYWQNRNYCNFISETSMATSYEHVY